MHKVSHVYARFCYKDRDVYTFVKKIYPFEVLLNERGTGLPKASKAQCHQIRTISKIRIKKPIALGNAIPSVMQRINQVLELHLALG